MGKIQNILQKDENILWKGFPHGETFVKYIILIIGYLIAINLIYIFMRISIFDFNTYYLIFFIFILLPSIYKYKDIKKKEKKLPKYFITNKRIIEIFYDNLKKARKLNNFKYYALESIEKIEIKREGKYMTFYFYQYNSEKYITSIYLENKRDYLKVKRILNNFKKFRFKINDRS